MSSGPQQLAVPTLVGLTQQQAIDALTGAGLTVGTITPQDSDQPAGTVLASTPKEGTQVAKGSHRRDHGVQREGEGAVRHRRAAGAGEGGPVQRRLLGDGHHPADVVRCRRAS